MCWSHAVGPKEAVEETHSDPEASEQDRDHYLLVGFPLSVLQSDT
jgi:hypothetical protein